MVVPASNFLSQFKRLKEYLSEEGKGSQELKDAFSKLNESFKKYYTPEAFKELLQKNGPICDDLEEKLNIALIVLNKEIATSSKDK
jgi:hypothetical protein